MLRGADKLFQSVKSIEYVCYRASEAADDELKRLLRELPGAGVTLIELDAWERAHGVLRSLNELVAGVSVASPGGLVSDLGVAPLPGELESGLAVLPGRWAYDLSATLLLAGSSATLALATGTHVATIGYGGLLTADDRADIPAGDMDTDTGVAADILVEGFAEVDVQFLDRIMKRAQGLPWITVITRRCYLREITMDDLDDLYALYAQPGITDYVEPLYDRPEEEQYTRDYIDCMYRFYGYGMWLVYDRESHALVGRAGFSHQDLGDEIVLEMGYIIGVPYQRQGYATEVCEKLLAFAREHLSDFGSVNCFVEPGNVASLALLRRLEFTQIGTVNISGKVMLRYQKML